MVNRRLTSKVDTVFCYFTVLVANLLQSRWLVLAPRRAREWLAEDALQSSEAVGLHGDFGLDLGETSPRGHR